MLRRVYALDVLACPDCGGRLRLLATIEDRAVVVGHGGSAGNAGGHWTD